MCQFTSVTKKVTYERLCDRNVVDSRTLGVCVCEGVHTLGGVCKMKISHCSVHTGERDEGQRPPPPDPPTGDGRWAVAAPR